MSDYFRFIWDADRKKQVKVVCNLCSATELPLPFDLDQSNDWELLNPDHYGMARLVSDKLGIEHPLHRSWEKVAAEPEWDREFHYDEDTVESWQQKAQGFDANISPGKLAAVAVLQGLPPVADILRTPPAKRPIENSPAPVAKVSATAVADA